MGDILRDEDDIGLSLECTLQHQVRGISSHESNEVPILDCTGCINHDISNLLRVGLGCRVKANDSLQHGMCDVVVDSAGNGDDPGLQLLLE